VMATLDIQARDAASVFVHVPGHLKEVYVQPGQRVRQGQVLAELESPELEKKIEELSAECQRNEAALKNRTREYTLTRDPQIALSIPQAEESLKSARKRLADANEEFARLKLVASADGTVLPPPATNPPSDPDGPLPSWSGTPFLPLNKGSYLREGTLFCQVGDPTQMEAVLVVDEADQPLVEKDQKATLKLDAFPYETIEGTITKVSTERMKMSPRRLSAKSGGELATKTNPVTGAEQPMSTSYQASVDVPDPDQIYRLGLRGRGKIHMDPDHWQTLGQRFWRFLTRTFHFRM
jgi:putative peptide zinc metalloprotease protein